MKRNFVFVYGTLKSGYALNAMMENGVFVEKFTLPKSFKLSMWDNGSYPMVIQEPNGALITEIQGEIFSVDDDDLRVLDQLEGLGVLYNRAKFDYNGEECFTYIFIDKVFAKECEYVSDGYFRYREPKYDRRYFGYK